MQGQEEESKQRGGRRKKRKRKMKEEETSPDPMNFPHRRSSSNTEKKETLKELLETRQKPIQIRERGCGQ